ncbi:MAG: hypothetical protein GF368_02150 [Candidatus Aenigmarchaeota archaeon]|nr:hypothetical protein [Candidatus Aenigmarchaeota archaeon]
MKIPTKFYLNLEDYKIYFDNKKKTYVCEDLETGEKTNIGVIGTFLQMGIIKAIEDNPGNPDERVAYLMDKVVSLEKRLGHVVQESKTLKIEDREEEIKKPKEEPLSKKEPEELEKKEREPILKKHPKKPEKGESIKERVMEKIIEKTVEEESEIPEDVEIESDEEIDNWMEI